MCAKTRGMKKDRERKSLIEKRQAARRKIEERNMMKELGLL